MRTSTKDKVRVAHDELLTHIFILVGFTLNKAARMPKYPRGFLC